MLIPLAHDVLWLLKMKLKMKRISIKVGTLWKSFCEKKTSDKQREPKPRRLPNSQSISLIDWNYKKWTYNCWCAFQSRWISLLLYRSIVFVVEQHLSKPWLTWWKTGRDWCETRTFAFAFHVGRAMGFGFHCIKYQLVAIRHLRMIKLTEGWSHSVKTTLTVCQISTCSYKTSENDQVN